MTVQGSRNAVKHRAGPSVQIHVTIGYRQINVQVGSHPFGNYLLAVEYNSFPLVIDGSEYWNIKCDNTRKGSFQLFILFYTFFQQSVQKLSLRKFKIERFF